MPTLPSPKASIARSAAIVAWLLVGCAQEEQSFDVVDTGAAGSSGSAGSGGSAGKGGTGNQTAGSGGAGGTGSGGSAGSIGFGGGGGNGGAGGSAGSSAAAGSSGAPGTSGAGGTAGASGSGGSSGAAGASGSAGFGGTAGSGGNAGASGSAGLGGNGGTGGCVPQTVAVSALADANLWADAPTTNYGDVAEFMVRANTAPFTRRALLRFDVGGVPAGVMIVSAALELTIVNNSGHAQTIAVHRVQQNPARPWVEAQATWNTFTTLDPWTAPGGDFAAQPTDQQDIDALDAPGTVVRWDVLPDVLDFYATPGDNFGWIVRDVADPAGGAGEHKYFGARNVAPPERRPRLVVEYCE